MTPERWTPSAWRILKRLSIKGRLVLYWSEQPVFVALPKLRESKLFQRVSAWTKRYERFWIPLMLVGGISGDVIQFSALNIYEKFTIMAVYVVVSTGALILIHYPRALEIKWLRGVRLAAPFAHQFSVGGLLSCSLLFYWFSGDISVSWPIIVLVAMLMLSNEFLRVHFLRPTVQMAVLSFSLFSLSSIFFSYVMNSLDPSVFLEAGAASLGFMLLFVFILTRIDHLERRRGVMIAVIVAVFGLMNAGYFLNVIPPIPLAIRAAGIYHNVTRQNGDYVLTGENESWIDKLLPGQTIHAGPSDTIFAYTAIFAPTDLSTTIVHKWQYNDPQTKTWTTEATISFIITGGRQQGYRGYTKKSHLTPGEWRVSVETTRGQVLGRIGFTVVNP